MNHLYSILSPLLFILGGIGNTLCIIVYLKIIIGKSGGAVSSSIILLFLACSDTIFLCEESLYTGFWVYTGKPFEALPLACAVKWFIQGTAYHVSGLTIAIFTLERMFAVTNPLKVHRIWTRRRTLMIVGGTVALWSLAECQYFYGIGTAPPSNETIPFRDLACTVTSLEYQYFLITTWAYVEAVLTFLEILTIFVGNAIIIWTINRRKVNSTDGNTSLRNREITRRLIAVSLVHLIVSVPWVVIATSQWAPDREGGSAKDIRTFIYFQFSLILIHIQSSVSFILYTLSGANFRQKVKELLQEIFVKITCRSIIRSLRERYSSRGGTRSTHSSHFSKTTLVSEISVSSETKQPLEELCSIDADNQPQANHCFQNTAYEEGYVQPPVKQSSIDIIL